MAVDMFIKIGDLKGEAQDQKHKDEIDVLSWNWGVSNSGSAHVGGGAGSGKANVQDLSFTKWMDKASPALLLACCNGKHFPQASLSIRKAGEKPVEYCKIKLTEVLISSVSTGGAGMDDRLTEHVTLNFGGLNFDYVPRMTQANLVRQSRWAGTSAKIRRHEARLRNVGQGGVHS